MKSTCTVILRTLWVILLLIIDLKAQSPPQKILFGKESGIFVVNEDGSNLTPLPTPIDALGSYINPKSSPDGTKIVFQFFPVDEQGNKDLFGNYIMNADGTGVKQLQGPNSDGFRWSPDGTQLAFISTDGSYIINSDGTNQKLVSRDFFVRTWSPDGKKLAGVYLPEEESIEIGIINIDGSNLTRVTNHPQVDTDVDWSPDGTKIVFISNREREANENHIYDIYVANTDGSNIVSLTYPLGARNPFWSPDGTKIVFGRGGIWIMNADGSGKTQLIEGPITFEADWWGGGISTLIQSLSWGQIKHGTR